MTNPHVAEQLLAYVNGNLDGASARIVEDHLALCAECRMELESFKMLWDDLGRSTAGLPARELERDFHTMLRAYEEGVRRTGPVRLRGDRLFDRLRTIHPAIQFGVAACLLLIGLASGYALKANVGNSRDIAQLHEEVRGLSNLLTVSLLKQESASDRLKGVSWGNKLVDHDPEIEAALVNTMKHDRNVNVRLAALDALTKDLGSPSIRSEIIRAFPEQTSPLVQIALVDVLSQINDRESQTVLRQALEKPDLRPEVRKRIQQGLEQTL